MNPIQLLKTIYCGDRYCENLTFLPNEMRVVLTVNVLSRIRGEDGKWNYYTNEDIAHARIIFTGVIDFKSTPEHVSPNDSINTINIRPTQEGRNTYQFSLSIDAVTGNGDVYETITEFFGDDVYIEDPSRPNVRIVD